MWSSLSISSAQIKIYVVHMSTNTASSICIGHRIRRSNRHHLLCIRSSRIKLTDNLWLYQIHIITLNLVVDTLPIYHSHLTYHKLNIIVWLSLLSVVSFAYILCIPVCTEIANILYIVYWWSFLIFYHFSVLRFCIPIITISREFPVIHMYLICPS